MSAEEFWKDDPQLFNSYRISFINQKQREYEEEDYISWLRGLYVHIGNGLLFNSLKQFIHNIVAGFTKGSKDNTKIEEYPKKPLNELRKEEKEEQKKEEKINNYKRYEENLVYYGTMKKRYEEKMLKKGE